MPGQSKHHHLYNSARWRKLARAQLQREPLCVFCLARGRVEAAVVADHTVPHNGNINAFWCTPLQSLCSSCHSRDKRHEEKHGYRLDIGEDGWPLDERHPAYQSRR